FDRVGVFVFFRNRRDFPVAVRIRSIDQEQAKKRRAAHARRFRKMRFFSAQGIGAIDRSVVNDPVLLKRKKRAHKKNQPQHGPDSTSSAESESMLQQAGGID